jgi:hypothetical protein
VIVELTLDKLVRMVITTITNENQMKEIENDKGNCTIEERKSEKLRASHFLRESEC